MKVLISISYYVPHLSGLTNTVRNTAELLARHEYVISVLTTQHEKKLPLQEEIHGVRIQRVPYLMKLYKGFIMPQYFFTAWRAVRSADMVLINLPQMEGWMVAVLAKCMGKRLYCYYVCDVTTGDSFVAMIAGKVLRLANILSLTLAETVITSSKDFATHTSLVKRFEKKVTIIPFLVSSPEIVPQAQERLTKRLLPKKRYQIGFIGRIATEKGIQYLLDAIPALQEKLEDDFRIVLAGPEQVVGEESYKEKISVLLQKYKKNIIHLGKLKDEELGAFYHMLNVLVLPSVNNTEAFGMVQVEAMYCGTPVVATDLPGVRVPVRLSGMGKIVPIRRSSALAEAIIEVVTQRRQYVKAKEAIQSLFSAKEVLRAYEKLFGE